MTTTMLTKRQKQLRRKYTDTRYGKVYFEVGVQSFGIPCNRETAPFLRDALAIALDALLQAEDAAK